MMTKHISSNLNNVVSTNLQSSWAAESIKEALDRRQDVSLLSNLQLFKLIGKALEVFHPNEF